MDGPVPEIPEADVSRFSVDPKKLPGLVVDNRSADTKGRWTHGTGLEGYVGWEYVYAGANSDSSIRFGIDVPEAGTYDVRIAYRAHENRATNVPVEVRDAAGKHELTVNMQVDPPLEGGFLSLGKFQFTTEKRGAVVISANGTDGHVCADALQLVPEP
jgi:hypothetical protein